jgi:hypothetical protein
MAKPLRLNRGVWIPQGRVLFFEYNNLTKVSVRLRVVALPPQRAGQAVTTPERVGMFRAKYLSAHLDNATQYFLGLDILPLINSRDSLAIFEKLAKQDPG